MLFNLIEKSKSIVVLIIIACICVSCSSTNKSLDRTLYEKDFEYQNDKYTFSNKRYDIISYGKPDDTTIGMINELNKNYTRILSDFDISESEMKKVNIFIYDDFEMFRDDAEAPSYYVGKAIDYDIHLVHPDAPNLNNERYTRDIAINRIIEHEFTHTVVNYLSEDVQLNHIKEWMLEGIADYEAIGDELYKNAPYLKGQEILIKNLQEINNGYIYRYGKYIIDYLVHEYGKEILRKLIDNPELSEKERFETTMGITTDELFKGWIEYMAETYGTKSN